MNSEILSLSNGASWIAKEVSALSPILIGEPQLDVKDNSAR